MKKFKYYAKFNVEATVTKKSFKDYQTKASVDELKELRTLLPDDEYIKENDDLLFCSFNLAVAGLINLNSHGILPETAQKMMNYWVNRPINIEHCRDRNVGVITSTGFSTFGENKMISIEDAIASKQPFNLCMGAVIWKVTDPWLVSYLEETNKKDSYSYSNLSTSWEVGFDEIAIARGSKNLFDAEIITDPDHVEELSKYLIQFGGTGFDENHKEVYMIISGDPRPLGGGITSNPAAAVKGIFIPEMEEDEEDNTKEECCDKIIKNNEEKSSQKVLFTVKHTCMKYKDLNDFCDKYSEAIAKQEVFATSELREFIGELVVKESEKIQLNVSSKEAELASANKKIEDLQAAIDVVKEESKTKNQEFDTIKQELAEIKQKAAEAQKAETLKTRLNSIKDKYELSDKVEKVISNSIENKSDEEYASWLENEGEVILAGKEKKTSTQPIEDAVKEVSASTELPPNASAQKKETEQEDKPIKVNKAIVKGRKIEVSLE